MKIFNLVFAILFVVSAALQYNDPDPYIWIPIYLFGAFLCWSSYQGNHHDGLYLALIAVCGVYGIYLLLDENGVISWARDHGAESLVQSMKADKPWIEETREFGGLIILIAVALVNLLVHRKTARA